MVNEHVTRLRVFAPRRVIFRLPAPWPVRHGRPIPRKPETAPRTNIHHTLKKKPLRFEDLADFIACYNPKNRYQRKPTWDAEKNPEGLWRKFSYEELTARDKTSLDVFWLKDKSLTDLDNLPEPDTLAEQIIENLEAGLASFREVLAGLRKGE